MTPKNDSAQELPVSQLALQQLISAPLRAMMEAQTASALASAELVRKISFHEPEPGKREIAMADFSHSRNGETRTIRVPLISLVPVQSLRISEAKLSFNVKMIQIEKRNGAMKAAPAYQKSGTTQKHFEMNMQVTAVQEELPASLLAEVGVAPE
ncbi:DUF2589 domain-containing protein [Chitinophaga sp.]|uniref:DUF2589 domain-containing protein n=1 Tax=Chitinophaga sp. TaxID=1869181 RepID=UPI00262DBFC4|nr:DUF2589 domain-containing protein [uncultured Chitinophaga sp.]